MKLHHIGIVVSNIQESMGELTKFLDFKFIDITVIEIINIDKIDILLV